MFLFHVFYFRIPAVIAISFQAMKFASTRQSLAPGAKAQVGVGGLEQPEKHQHDILSYRLGCHWFNGKYVDRMTCMYAYIIHLYHQRMSK